RVAYILGVPLAENVVRQWPQMGEIVRTSKLVAEVEGNFPELTLEVGRRLQLADVIVVEWTCNYGDGRLYRNVTIGELKDGQAVRVTDYWGAPTRTGVASDACGGVWASKGETEPTITAVLERGPLAGRRIDVDVVEGRPPKTIDVPADGGGSCRYCLADWVQAGSSTICTSL